MNISRDDASTWASWFRALGDPTRVLILNLLATSGRAMSVAEIVDAVDVGQSTVSHHLKILGDVQFVLVHREGTTSWWRMNEECLDCFPTAAELVMGRFPTEPPWDQAARQSNRSKKTAARSSR
ncbi:MAG: ArsR/SmtB family transcription factor [Ilumatobacteraceae bacterium]